MGNEHNEDDGNEEIITEEMLWERIPELQGEIEQAITELASLQLKYNLRLNKKKSEILTAEKDEQIGEIRCTRTVKYLGVKVNVDVKL